MYRVWLIRLLIAFAVVGIPIQGMAEALTAILCLPHMHASSAHTEHSHAKTGHHSDDHSSADHPHAYGTDGSGDQGSVDHTCCSIVTSGAPPSMPVVLIPAALTSDASPEVPLYLVFLETPQRPPLA